MCLAGRMATLWVGNRMYNAIHHLRKKISILLLLYLIAIGKIPISVSYAYGHMTFFPQVSIADDKLAADPLVAKVYDSSLIKVTDVGNAVVGQQCQFKGKNL